MSLAREGIALLANTSGSYKVNGLRFLTALHYQSSLIKIANNMTFFYDPNWSGAGNTLPISFFFVKDYKEVMESEVSQKTLLFYNSQETNNSDAVKGSLLGVVSDNIINKPKKYQMEILLPSNASKYMEQYQFDPYYDIGNIAIDNVEQNDYFGKFVNDFTGTIYKANNIIVNIVLDIVKALVKTLDSTNILSSSLQQLILDTQSDSNKSSLEAMWENRTIVKMKTWDGWKYKYVAIENCSISKKGEDDGFYEAYLTVTELPIMTVNSDTKITRPKVSYLTGAIDSAMKGVLVANVKSKINTILGSVEKLAELREE